MNPNENAVAGAVADTGAVAETSATVAVAPAAPVKPAKAKSKAKAAPKAKAPKAKAAPKAGRPRLKVALPPGNFTFVDLAVHNGAMDEEGNVLPKGKRRMCVLTLRNFVKRDKELGESSVLVVRADKSEEPKGGKLGRKRFVFSRRSAVKNSALIVAANSPVTVTAADAPAEAPAETPAPAVETAVAA